MTLTAKRRKTLLWASLALAPFLILFSLVFIFPVANPSSGVASLILERQPLQAKLTGDYKYSAFWGTATFNLNPDGTFKGTVTEKAATPKRFDGSWSSREDGNSVMVDFQPFGMKITVAKSTCLG